MKYNKSQLQAIEDLAFACKLWPCRDDRSIRLGRLHRVLTKMIKEFSAKSQKVEKGRV